MPKKLIECLFSCLKSRGFNFENTHLVNLDRIEKLLALLAITFTLCHMLGIWQNEIKPIKIKPHKRKAMSLFRYGLNFLRKLLFHPSLIEAKLQAIIDNLGGNNANKLKQLILC